MPKTKVHKVPDFDKGYKMGYNKGYKDGRLEGFEFHTVLMLLAMKDHLKLDNDRIVEINNSVNTYITMVSKGFLDYQSAKRMLSESYNWNFEWTD